MEHLQVLVKNPTYSGAWLRRNAIKFGMSMANKPNKTKFTIFDGYIFRAVRMPNRPRVIVYVLDTAALIALPCVLLNNGSGNPLHTPVLSRAAGRDFFLLPPVNPPVVESQYPGHSGTIATPALIVGELFSNPVIGSTVRPTMTPFPGLGFIQMDTDIHMHEYYQVNPYAFMDRTDRIAYGVLVQCPTIIRGEYVAPLDAGSGWTPPEFSTTAVLPYSMMISDSLINTFGGLLPFCKRVAPPPYDPTSIPATTYSTTQNPWAKAFFLQKGTNTEDPPEDFYSVLVCIQAVFEMVNDSDRFGARGIWVGKLTVTGTEVTLDWYQTIDRRDSADPYARPWKLGIDPDLYTVNREYPVLLCRVGVRVLMVTNHLVSQTTPPFDSSGTFEFYNTVNAYWVDDTEDDEGIGLTQLVAGPVLSISGPLEGTPHDLAMPLGVDSDGTTAHGVWFSSDHSRDAAGAVPVNTSIDIFRFTDSTATLVLSTMIPQRYCLYADSNSRYECVKYIGNGKWVFPASNNTVDDPGFIGLWGDLSIMQYDSNTNTVSLIGSPDPVPNQFGERMHFGALDCPVQELGDEDGVTTRPATILLTMGGLAQEAGRGGGEIGQTFISYDSGVTWFKIASYGSPAGARYCGTQIQARMKEF